MGAIMKPKNLKYMFLSFGFRFFSQRRQTKVMFTFNVTHQNVLNIFLSSNKLVGCIYFLFRPLYLQSGIINPTLFASMFTF